MFSNEHDTDKAEGGNGRDNLISPQADLESVKARLSQAYPGAFMFIVQLKNIPHLDYRFMFELSKMVADANPTILTRPDLPLVDPLFSAEFKKLSDKYKPQWYDGFVLSGDDGTQRMSAEKILGLYGALSFGNSIYEDNFLKGKESMRALIEAGIASQQETGFVDNVPKLISAFS